MTTAAVAAIKAAFRLAVADAGGIDAVGKLIGRSPQQVARYYDPGSPDTPSARVVALVEASGPSLHVTRALATLRGAAVVEIAPEIPHAPIATRLAVIGRTSGAVFAEGAAALADQRVTRAEAARLAAAVRDLVGAGELLAALLEAR